MSVFKIVHETAAKTLATTCSIFSSHCRCPVSLRRVSRSKPRTGALRSMTIQRNRDASVFSQNLYLTISFPLQIKVLLQLCQPRAEERKSAVESELQEQLTSKDAVHLLQA